MNALTPGSMLGSLRCTAWGIVTSCAVVRCFCLAGFLLGGRRVSRRGNRPVPPIPLHWSAFADARFAWDQKKFAEPVSLSSTVSADLPLPGTAFGLGFDLLALRARRRSNLTCPARGSRVRKRARPQFAE